MDQSVGYKAPPPGALATRLATALGRENDEPGALATRLAAVGALAPEVQENDDVSGREPASEPESPQEEWL